MKSIVLATATTLIIATSASASGMTFSLPNLTFPPADTVTVTKDCLSLDTTAPTCPAAE